MRCLPGFILLLSNIAFAAEETQLEFYRPFGNESEYQLVVGRHMVGECSQQSLHIKREDAWRCQAEGKTYDPCFMKEYGDHKAVICPQSPWNTTSVQIDLPRAADNSQHESLDMSQTYPWAVELDSGEKCQAIDEGRVFDGMPIHYQCDSQTVLLGHLQRCKTQWSILKQDVRGQINRVLIEKAWF